MIMVANLQVALVVAGTIPGCFIGVNSLHAHSSPVLLDELDEDFPFLLQAFGSCVLHLVLPGCPPTFAVFVDRLPSWKGF